MYLPLPRHGGQMITTTVYDALKFIQSNAAMCKLIKIEKK